jgi:hypothetical protein
MNIEHQSPSNPTNKTSLTPPPPPPQTILQTLQIQPPGPPPQRPLQIETLRRHKRSLLHPGLPRKAPVLRPRLPPLLLLSLRPPQRPPRLLLLPQHARRRPPSLWPKQAAHAIQRPAALLLRLRRLGRAEREALAARAQRPRRHLRPSDRTCRDRAGGFHSRGGQRHSAFRPEGTSCEA